MDRHRPRARGREPEERGRLPGALCRWGFVVGDLVATTREAAEAFEVAELRELDTLAAHVHRTVITSQILDASRVRAYERAWCASLAAHVEAHPGDPRNAWARARLAWAEDPSLEAARDALRFAVFVL